MISAFEEKEAHKPLYRYNWQDRCWEEVWRIHGRLVFRQQKITKSTLGQMFHVERLYYPGKFEGQWTGVSLVDVQ